MLGVHVRKFGEGGEHRGRQNIKNILCCFRTRQLQGRVTLMILSKLINTLLMLLKLSHGWRKKSQLSPVMTMAKMRTVHRYEIHLDAWCVGSFICSFANSYILFSSSRHCWPNMLPSCQTWELMELKSMDYENKVKTARSVLWSDFLLDCKFNSASWDIDLLFSSVLRMPMIFFRWKKVVFLLMS